MNAKKAKLIRKNQKKAGHDISNAMLVNVAHTRRVKTAKDVEGKIIGSVRSGRFDLITETTSGMTSPARRTITVSPTRPSFRCAS